MCFRPLTRSRCGSWMIPNQLCEKVLVSPFSSIQSRFAFPEVFCLWNKLQLLRRLSPKDSVPGPYEILGLRHRYRFGLSFGVDSTLLFRRMGPLVRLPTKNWWRLGGSFEKAGDPASWHKPFYELRSWHVSRVGVSQAPEKCVLKIQWKLEGGPVRGFVWNGLALIFIQFVLHSFFFVFGWLCEKLAFATSNSTISLKSLWPWDQDLTISRVQVLSASTCHLYLHLLLLTELYMRHFFCTKICSVKQISFKR